MEKEERSAATIKVNISEGQRIEIRCGLGEKVIGRSGGCDLILPDPSVSRTHARIVGTSMGFFLEDLSKNGTFIDGRRISKEVLPERAAITIGPYLLHFTASSGETVWEEDVPTQLFDGSARCSDFPGGEGKKEDIPETPEEVGILGKSKAVTLLFDMMARVGQTSFPVLITGETGTGKELVARGIHLLGKRRRHPFVAINCSAISPEIVESELFGHEKGAFTGALSRRKGAFEIAAGGTLFLDEVGDMPANIQPKLLRALEESEIRRVGSNTTLKVNTRVIAATNKLPTEEVAAHRFRKDLYFRLNSFPIHVAPLRERKEDVEILALYFLSLFDAAYGGSRKITPGGIRYLRDYPWPGNIRELKNGINRAAILADGEIIDTPTLTRVFSGSIPSLSSLPGMEAPPGTLRKIERAERDTIVRELIETGWNKTRAAKNLGISKSTLFEKLKRYQITSP